MNIILLLGVIILAGFLGKKLSNLVKLPGVTGYLIFGVILGQSAFNLLTPAFLEKTGFITDITLGFVGFIIGNQLAFKKFTRVGKGIITMIMTESFGAFILVSIMVYLLTHRIDLALLLGAIAPASAPAGTVAVVQEYRSKGILTNTLLAVVGLDDGLGIIIYVFTAAVVKSLVFGTGGFSINKILFTPIYKILLAIIVGGVAGLFLSYLLKKIRMKEEMMVLIFGFILLFTGIARYMHISLILLNLSMGMIVANFYPFLSAKLSRIFDETIPVLYIVFFVLAGAHLNVRFLPQMGLLGIVYILSRTTGLIGGASFGAFVSNSPSVLKKYLGLGILSQAGVAIGLSLLVVREFSSYGKMGEQLSSIIVTTIAATTIFFEILGPITTKIAITKAGEIGKGE